MLTFLPAWTLDSTLIFDALVTEFPVIEVMIFYIYI